MFTGIVQEVGSTISVAAGQLHVAAGGILKGVELGGSIAVNGVCLTVTAFDGRSFTVDVMPETLDRTNLGLLRRGDKVNLERPLALGGELGGHLVQGHVDDTGKITAITPEDDALLMKFETDPEIMRYIVPKGFIAVDGISLTVTAREARTFDVSIVDFTRRHTTLGDKKAGDTVNLEVDIIGKYVAEFVRPQSAGITAAFLQEHGFPVR
jgi:riboflavin synthase